MFDHEARRRTDTAWTIFEYDGPVGERLWLATIPAGTTVPLVHAVLQHLDSPLPPCATEPYSAKLRDAGWHRASHPGRTVWRAPDRTLTFEHVLHDTDAQWVLYGGNHLDRAAWVVGFSTGVPHVLLGQLADTAAVLHGTVVQPPARHRQPASAAHITVSVPVPRPRVR
ncbi:hypothetical protein AB0M38_11045 [Streptomyces sp. NPDC051742]|uniref:hypothetical protein n=1 Tax=unclassified Streptomyces TaxID=2593676 RepID=UPI003439C90B